MKKEQILTKEQEKFLRDFIIVFLPEKGNNRKYSGNELSYIKETLDLLFKKN